jgi:hypothetical protein
MRRRYILTALLFLATVGVAVAQIPEALRLRMLPANVTGRTSVQAVSGDFTNLTVDGTPISTGSGGWWVTTSTDQTVTGVKTLDERLIQKDLGGTPATPGSGYGGWYVDGDKPYFIDDGGTTYDLSSSGAPANMMTTDTAQTASGVKTWTTQQQFNLGILFPAGGVHHRIRDNENASAHYLYNINGLTHGLYWNGGTGGIELRYGGSGINVGSQIYIEKLTRLQADIQGGNFNSPSIRPWAGRSFSLKDSNNNERIEIWDNTLDMLMDGPLSIRDSIGTTQMRVGSYPDFPVAIGLKKIVNNDRNYDIEMEIPDITAGMGFWGYTTDAADVWWFEPAGCHSYVTLEAEDEFNAYGDAFFWSDVEFDFPATFNNDVTLGDSTATHTVELKANVHPYSNATPTLAGSIVADSNWNWNDGNITLINLSGASGTADSSDYVLNGASWWIKGTGQCYFTGGTVSNSTNGEALNVINTYNGGLTTSLKAGLTATGKVNGSTVLKVEEGGTLASNGTYRAVNITRQHTLGAFTNSGAVVDINEAMGASATDVNPLLNLSVNNTHNAGKEWLKLAAPVGQTNADDGIVMNVSGTGDVFAVTWDGTIIKTTNAHWLWKTTGLDTGLNFGGTSGGSFLYYKVAGNDRFYVSNTVATFSGTYLQVNKGSDKSYVYCGSNVGSFEGYFVAYDGNSDNECGQYITYNDAGSPYGYSVNTAGNPIFFTGASVTDDDDTTQVISMKVFAVTTDTSNEFTRVAEKTVVADADKVLIEDSAASGAKKYVQVSNLKPVFGQEFENDYTATQFSHTGDTNWTQAHRFTTASKPIGTYRVGISFEYVTDNDEKCCFFRAQVDDSTDIFNHFTEDRGKQTDGQWRSISGFHYITFGSATTHTVDIDVQLDGAGDTIYVRNRKVEIWRVN